MVVAVRLKSHGIVLCQAWSVGPRKERQLYQLSISIHKIKWETLTCHHYACPSGDSEKNSASTDYRESNCCQKPTCETYSCQLGYFKKANADSLLNPSRTRCCDFKKCTEKATEGTSSASRFATKLSTGVDVITGRSSPLPIFELADPRHCGSTGHRGNCSHLYRSSIGETMKTYVVATNNYAEVSQLVASSEGFRLSIAASQKKGFQRVAGRAMFSETQMMKKAYSTIVKSSYWFSSVVLESLIQKVDYNVHGAVLSESFVKMVQQLDGNSSYEDFAFLFQTFGTHFISQGEVGGRVESYKSMTKTSITKLGSAEATKCHRREVDLSFSKGLLSGSEGTADMDTTKCKSSTTVTKDSKSVAGHLGDYGVHGGNPGVFLCGDPETKWQRFVRSLDDYTAEVWSTELNPIWSLFVKAGQFDAKVMDSAETNFYKYVVAQAELIKPPDDFETSSAPATWRLTVLVFLVLCVGFDAA